VAAPQAYMTRSAAPASASALHPAGPPPQCALLALSCQ
jgi:hypothetical protein